MYKVSDPELASDMVQDTFLAAAEKIDGFKEYFREEIRKLKRNISWKLPDLN